MCIINRKASVKGTQILVLPDHTQTRQLVVYANKVQSRTPNAMILPVPHPETVQFHDLSHYTGIFSNCATTLDIHIYADGFGTLSTNAKGARSIRVERVGGYLASLVPSLADLGRLDTETFRINPECYRFLEQYYNRPGWGFIVCQLDLGERKYHPFGYSHQLYHKGHGLASIPTRHYHDGERQTSRTPADWDHEIYVGNPQPWAVHQYQPKPVMGQSNSLSLTKLRLAKFNAAPIHSFGKIVVKGNLRNADLFAQLKLADQPLPKIKGYQIYYGIDGTQFQVDKVDSDNFYLKPTDYLTSIPIFSSKDRTPGHYLARTNTLASVLSYFGAVVRISLHKMGMLVTDNYGTDREESTLFYHEPVITGDSALVHTVYVPWKEWQRLHPERVRAMETADWD